MPKNNIAARLPDAHPDAAPRRKLGAVPPRRSAAGPRGEVPGGAFEARLVRYELLLNQVAHPALHT